MRLLPKKIFQFLLLEHIIFTLVGLAIIIISFISLKLFRINYILDLSVLGFTEISELIFVMIPTVLDFAIPISLVLSSCATMHKLSVEKAILAVRTMGFSVSSLLLPILLSSMIFGVIHFLNLNFLRPISNSVLNVTVTKFIEMNLTELIKPATLTDLGSAKVYVGSRGSEDFSDAKIFILDDSGAHFFSADKVQIRVLKDLSFAQLNLKDGYSLSISSNLDFDLTEFRDNSISIPLNLKINKEFKLTSELKNRELIDLYFKIKEVLTTGKNLDQNLSEVLMVKYVTPESVKAKAINIKKEFTRRFFFPIFDILLSLLGFLLGINLWPKVHFYYYPTAYIFSVLLVVLVSLSADFFSEKIFNPAIILSEGYLTLCLILGILTFKGIFTLSRERAFTGMSAIFGFK